MGMGSTPQRGGTADWHGWPEGPTPGTSGSALRMTLPASPPRREVEYRSEVAPEAEGIPRFGLMTRGSGPSQAEIAGSPEGRHDQTVHQEVGTMIDHSHDMENILDNMLC